MNIPCLIAVKNATKIIKDGDQIEVDAINGIIKRLVVWLFCSGNEVSLGNGFLKYSKRNIIIEKKGNICVAVYKVCGLVWGTISILSRQKRNQIV